MSGFGIRALKKVDDNDKKENLSQFYRYIVLGENTYGVLTFLKLHKKYPGEVKFITKNPFLKEDILHEWKCYLNSFRSTEVAEAFMSLNPRFEIFPKQTSVKFYKDTKFHNFGGRAKPHEIRAEELFFTQPAYYRHLEVAFNEFDFEHIDELLKEHQLHKIISSIEVTEPTDLVEKSHFMLETGEQEYFSCEKLFFCESPKKFYQLVSNKEKLSDTVQAFCAGLKQEQAISVHFLANKEIAPEECVGTVFLPQSMTHDWGSFILDIHDYNPENQKQEFQALAFISEDDLQEEDLAKKIKLMKRVIERVFPQLSKADLDQSITFSDEYRISGINDTHSKALECEAVKFYGHGAALSHPNADKFHYMARGLYAILSSEL